MCSKSSEKNIPCRHRYWRRLACASERARAQHQLTFCAWWSGHLKKMPCWYGNAFACICICNVYHVQAEQNYTILCMCSVYLCTRASHFDTSNNPSHELNFMAQQLILLYPTVCCCLCHPFGFCWQFAHRSTFNSVAQAKAHTTNHTILLPLSAAYK